MRAALLVLAVALAATGCSTWRAQGLTPNAVIEREHPERLRVATHAGARIDLKFPRVVGDSLFGVAADGPRAIALEDIDHVAVRREDTARSAIVAPLVAGCVMALIIMADEISHIPFGN